MNNFLKKVELESVCKDITVGFVGSMQKEYVQEGIPLLRSLNVKPYKLDLSDIKYISKEFHTRIKKSSLKKHDVVVVRTGLPGTSCVIDGNISELNCSDLVIARPDTEQIDPYYLSYYFNSVAKKFVNNHAVGAIQQHFNIGSAKKMMIGLPSISIQRNISLILNQLNQKIELNNRINAELEGMAKLIYDYWFVQFDFPYDFRQRKPADETSNSKDVKPYKSSGGKMVWNGELKREVPEGWDLRKLEEIESKIITGKTPSTKILEYFDGDIPFITIDDIRKDLYIFKSDRSLSQKGADSQISKYLFPGDISVSCIGTIGVIGIIGKVAQTNQQINTISNIKNYNRFFLLNALIDYFNFNVGAKKGAVLDNMNKKEFTEIPIVDAPEKIKELYFEKVNPIYEKIENNLKQNQELSALRDWLLPMLMNGQVNIHNKLEKNYEVRESDVGIAAESGMRYAEFKNPHEQG